MVTTKQWSAAALRLLEIYQPQYLLPTLHSKCPVSVTAADFMTKINDHTLRLKIAHAECYTFKSLTCSATGCPSSPNLKPHLYSKHLSHTQQGPITVEFGSHDALAQRPSPARSQPFLSSLTRNL